jgi:integrase
MNRKCHIPVVRFDEWPAADQQTWDAALRDGDVLDEPGPLAHYSPDRLISVRSAYGRWLGFLNGDLTEGIGSSGVGHIERERVSRYLEALRCDLAPRSVITYLEDLGYAVRGMSPDLDVGFIVSAGRYMRQFTRSTRNKRNRLRSPAELYELGLELMQQAEAASGRVKAAVVYRDGLTIALLAARPIRVRNLASIETGRHLVARGDEYWLEFPAEEVKNRRSLEFPLPLAQHHPVLVAQAKCPDNGIPSNLWLSRLGTPITTHRMWWNICKRTEQKFGHPINPHLFRDAAATSVAIEDPAHVYMIVRILGHATLAVAEKHYNQATSLEAARRMQAELRTRYRKP